MPVLFLTIAAGAAAINKSINQNTAQIKARPVPDRSSLKSAAMIDMASEARWKAKNQKTAQREWYARSVC